MSNYPHYYWYKSGGFVIAVDATGTQDARRFLDITYPGREFEFIGAHIQGHTYTTACCGVTPKRQEEIHNNLVRDGFVI